VRIVITGLPSEVTTAKELIKNLLIVWSESRTFQSRSAATPDAVTVYVSADLPGGTGEKS
jgi:hypothetical protein